MIAIFKMEHIWLIIFICSQSLGVKNKDLFKVIQSQTEDI